MFVVILQEGGGVFGRCACVRSLLALGYVRLVYNFHFTSLSPTKLEPSEAAVAVDPSSELRGQTPPPTRPERRRVERTLHSTSRCQ